MRWKKPAAKRKAQRRSGRDHRRAGARRAGLREALAKGADRAIHLEDDGFVGLDAFNTAKRLRRRHQGRKVRSDLHRPAVRRLRLRADRRDLAELLGWPHATIIMQIEKAGWRHPGQARTRSRMLPVRRYAAARGADHPVRHQQTALRHADRHQAGQEQAFAQSALAEVQSALGETCRRSRGSTFRRKPRTPR